MEDVVARQYGPAPERDIKLLHAHSHPLPEFPALTHIHEVHTGPKHFIPIHTHKTFEISYIHSGRGEYVAEGRTYQLSAGDLYITKPGETHGGRVDPHDPYLVFVIGIEPLALPLIGSSAARVIDVSRNLPAGVPVFNAPANDIQLAVSEARVLSDDFRALNERIIPGGQGIEQIYRRILAELDRPCAEGDKARALKLLMVQALLIELLVFIARCYSAHRASLTPDGTQRTPERAEFQQLLAWLRSTLADPPSLADMAEKVGLSPAHFSVVFKQQTGQTPLEFLTAARVEQAGRMLCNSRTSVTDIALDLGFSSSQYFSLVFKKATGCTPGEWRKGRRAAQK
jgi:AraC family transcriptional regulator, L-rhamnose operon regulatory protein RhaS